MRGKNEMKKQDFKIENARSYRRKNSSKKPDTIFFTLVICDIIKIYSCSLGLSRKGEWFICYPSHKKDDKYYNHAWVDLRDYPDIEDYIIDMVFDAADEER